MKKLLVSDISNTIYLTNAKEDTKHKGLLIATGEKQDYTDEAIRAVFQWFINNYRDNEPNTAYRVTYPSSEFELILCKKGTFAYKEDKEIEVNTNEN